MNFIQIVFYQSYFLANARFCALSKKRQQFPQHTTSKSLIRFPTDTRNTAIFQRQLRKEAGALKVSNNFLSAGCFTVFINECDRMILFNGSAFSNSVLIFDCVQESGSTSNVCKTRVEFAPCYRSCRVLLFILLVVVYRDYL